MKKVSDIIALKLKQENITVAFGIIGSANAHIFDSIKNLGFTKIICLHHEQALIMAMAAYYRTSGKMSVAIVTAGAGAGNAITGVLSNWADSIPGVILSGQEPSRYLNNGNGRMYGTQGFNSAKMVEDITKYSKCVTDENEINNVLSHAFFVTNSGRPGPVWVEIPFDIQAKIIHETKSVKNAVSTLGTSIADDFAEEIIGYLKFAKNPIILAGNGVHLAKANLLLTELLNKTNVPFMSTWSGIDLIDNMHPRYYGRFGLYGQRHANFIVQKSDFILCLGSRMAIPQIGYQINEFAPNAKIVVVDIDEKETAKYSRFVPINYNVKNILEALVKKVNTDFDRPDWIKECEFIKGKFPLINEDYLKENQFVNSYVFLNKLSKQIPKGDVVVTDMGTALLSGHQVMEVSGYRMFTSQGLGEMGVGLPYAVGASIALKEENPNGTIHCLNCDGGIMMNLQELHTIVKLSPVVKIIIFNNLGYLMIKHTQKMLFNGSYTAVDKTSGVDFPNFENLAGAFGFDYLKLELMNNYDEIMSDYFNNSVSTILEVMMNPEQDFIPKVKGVPVAESTDIFSPPLEEMSPLLDLTLIQQIMGQDISPKSFNINRNKE